MFRSKIGGGHLCANQPALARYSEGFREQAGEAGESAFAKAPAGQANRHACCGAFQAIGVIVFDRGTLPRILGARIFESNGRIVG